MNNQHRKELVDYWLERAGDSVKSSESELQAGRLAFAINRMYYALFYAVTASLAAQGKKLGKHSAVRAAFHRDFVRKGKVHKSYGRLYDELFNARQQGDYLPLVKFDRAVVKSQLSEVKRFLAEFSIGIRDEI